MYIHHYRHPVGRELKTVIIRYVCEKITVAYRKQPVWSKHADSSVPIRAGDKKHNDSVQTGRKQRLEAGVSVLYSKFKVEDCEGEKNGNCCRIIARLKDRNGLYHWQNSSHITEFVRWSVPPSASPAAVCCFMLTDMHDGGSVISPSRNTAFNSLTFNNENINCNALNR